MATAGPRRSHLHRVAAEQAVRSGRVAVALPFVGAVTLPPTQHLVWYAGVGVLALLDVVDWPIALLLALGKALADNRSSESLRELGDALDQVG